MQRRTEDIIRAELKLLFDLSSRVGRELFPHETELEIEYQKEFSGVETRRITSQSLFMFSDEVYLNAFCHHQQKVRTFKTARIQVARSSDGHGISPYPSHKLNVCDFFVHPKTWGDYRKPCAILARKMTDLSVPKAERFRFIFQFASQSLERGAWSDFYKEGKAAGVAFLTFATDLKGYAWQMHLENMRGGRFDKSAFQEALEAADQFRLGKSQRSRIDADASSA
jgi:hypothetical protein